MAFVVRSVVLWCPPARWGLARALPGCPLQASPETASSRRSSFGVPAAPWVWGQTPAVQAAAANEECVEQVLGTGPVGTLGAASEDFQNSLRMCFPQGPFINLTV